MTSRRLIPLSDHLARLANGWSWLLSSNGALREHAARSAFWLLAGDAGIRVSGLLKIAILGHLLAPADFGLAGVALMLLQWFGYFTQTGFDAALIHKREDIRQYLDSVWTIQIVRGFCIGAALFFVAPLAAAFFRAPGAVSLVRLIALEVVLYGFTNPAVIYLRKELHSRREVAWRATGTVTGLIVGITAAVLWRNAFALVVSTVAARAAETVSSYWVWVYRPRLHINWQLVRELSRFGRWVFGTNIIIFLELQADTLIIGRLLGASALGIYQVASQFALLPTAQIGTVLSAVLFPVFSTLDTKGQLRNSVTTSLSAVLFLVLPFACIVTLFSDVLVTVSLGHRWLATCSVMAVLCWAGVARAVTAVFTSLFLAEGRAHLPLYGAVLRVGLLPIFLSCLLPRYGLVGVAGALAGSALIVLAYQLVLAVRSVGITRSDLVALSWPAVTACVPWILAHTGYALSGNSFKHLWMVTALSLYVPIALSIMMQYIRQMNPRAAAALSVP